jgi:chemotaxis protein MotB
MSAAGQPVVVVKRRGHRPGHHGGAWKVAYADFVTAMMAFFLVMWLVGQSKSVKAAVGGYFRDPAAFAAEGGRGVLPGGTAVDMQMERPAQPKTDADGERQQLEAAVKNIREQLDRVAAFKPLRNQIEFTVTPEGLRIDLVERDDSTFFDSGSAVLRGESERILTMIAHELGALDHRIVIEGHTDSRPYASSDGYSNWELSADRANAARRVMERGGLRPGQITGVLGLADRELRVPSDPFDAHNRRVTILVKRSAEPAQAAR